MANQKIPVLIIGTGDLARLALDIANEKEVLAYGFLTQDEEEVRKELNDILVVAHLTGKDGQALLGEENLNVVVAERDIEQRKTLVKGLSGYKLQYINMVHPDAWISPYASLDMGNIVGPGVNVLANAEVGKFNVIETGVLLESDVLIGDHTTLHAGVKVGRGAEIADGAFVSMGAIIHPNVYVGEAAVVGPGAVVLSDVPDGATAHGNPAVVIESD
ncbi:MAG: hypothetical protein AAFR61_09015 [Bacteroidota bacterium]